MDDEKHILACCLYGSEVVQRALKCEVRPELFNDDLNREIWKGLVARCQQGQEPEIVWIKHRVEELGRKYEYVTSLTEAFNEVVYPLREAQAAAEFLWLEYKRREARRLIAEYDPRLAKGDPNQLLSEIAAHIQSLIACNQGGDDEAADLQLLAELKETPAIVSTGFTQLDRLVKGIEPGALWIVGGYTSNGKTAFALNFAVSVASQGRPVTFFSTEMSRKTLTKRIATMLSGINMSAIQDPTDRDEAEFAKGVERAIALPLKVIHTLSLPEIQVAIRQGKSGLYVVDYIQMLDPGALFETETHKLGHVVRELEKLTKTCDTCIIATSQLNRARHDEGPRLSSYRGSGEIEENTDIGMLLFFPYQEASPKQQKQLKTKGKETVINLSVLKNRNHGHTGMVKFRLDPRSLRLTQVENEVATKGEK